MKSWKIFTAAVGVAVAGITLSLAQAPSGDPGPQLPRPAPPTYAPCPDDATILCVTTPQGLFPIPAPNTTTNFLQTVYSNNRTDAGVDMPNTLPSTPQNPYNLIANFFNNAVPTTTIDPTSPSQDLARLFNQIIQQAQQNLQSPTASTSLGGGSPIQQAIDILEGNPIKSRPTYSGIPVLHYKGPMKVQGVTPIYDSNGTLIGGNVNVHQVWFDNHIESDTAMIDPTAVQNVPWTITYKVDILHRGEDDFAPFVMYFSDPPTNVPGSFGPPHVGMDQTFFPMNEGTEMTMQIKQAPGKYWNLLYTWGWRRHPPRVQVMENALKKGSDGTISQTLPQWEVSVFGACPTCGDTQKNAAISQLGSLSPEKRMWTDLKKAQVVGSDPSVISLIQDAQAALADYSNRNQLPTGVTADPNADVTLFFVNNTIYGNQINFKKWVTRPATFNVTLLNGDNFEHGYMNVDFGGARGWENTFQSTTNDTAGGVLGGSGCWFTFGRVHWWINAGGPFGPIIVPPASGTTPGVKKVRITLNFEPTARLRLYQFDPLHHDVAIYSLH
jgi:hypothetical protein